MEQDFQQVGMNRPMNPIPKPKKARNNSMTTILKYFALVVLLVLAGFGVWALVNYNTIKSGSNDVAAQNAKVLAQIKRIAAFLPEDEQPALGKIDNIEEAKKQNPDFYAKAANGDYIIIYRTKIKTAILFSPSRNQILSIVALTDEDIKNLESGGQGTNSTTKTTP